MTFKVGDRVKLTGKGWDGEAFPKRGSVCTVRAIDADGYARIPSSIAGTLGWIILDANDPLDGPNGYMRRDWAAELVQHAPIIITGSTNDLGQEGEPGWDVVDLPKHYTAGTIEVWDFIIDQGLSYCLGNVVKYVSRAGKKDPAKHIEDLKKAQAYLAREIERVEEERG